MNRGIKCILTAGPPLTVSFLIAGIFAIAITRKARHLGVEEESALRPRNSLNSSRNGFPSGEVTSNQYGEANDDVPMGSRSNTGGIKNYGGVIKVPFARFQEFLDVGLISDFADKPFSEQVLEVFGISAAGSEMINEAVHEFLNKIRVFEVQNHNLIEDGDGEPLLLISAFPALKEAQEGLKSSFEEIAGAELGDKIYTYFMQFSGAAEWGSGGVLSFDVTDDRMVRTLNWSLEQFELGKRGGYRAVPSSAVGQKQSFGFERWRYGHLVDIDATMHDLILE